MPALLEHGLVATIRKGKRDRSVKVATRKHTLLPQVEPGLCYPAHYVLPITAVSGFGTGVVYKVACAVFSG